MNLWRRQDRLCPWCGEPITPEQYASPLTTVDHWRPRSHGGSSRQENLRLMHRRCNSKKGSTCPDEDCDSWQHHGLNPPALTLTASSEGRGQPRAGRWFTVCRLQQLPRHWS